MTNFKIGQKIVCVNDRHFSKEGEEVPVQNKIYTIRDIIPIDERGFYFRFEEIVNFPRPYGDIGFVECCFSQYAFKPMEYISATSEILEKFKIIEEKADVEIKELENV